MTKTGSGGSTAFTSSDFFMSFWKKKRGGKRKELNRIRRRTELEENEKERQKRELMNEKNERESEGEK